MTSSFANLALGTLLLKGGDAFSAVYEVWRNNNANFSSLIQHVAQFAYRPLSSDSSNNMIDSRTYYVMEDFLSQRDRGLLENDSFVTNWVIRFHWNHSRTQARKHTHVHTRTNTHIGYTEKKNTCT